MSSIIKKNQKRKHKKQNSKKNAVNFYDYAKQNNINFEIVYDGSKKSNNLSIEPKLSQMEITSGTPSKNHTEVTSNQYDLDSDGDTYVKLDIHKTSSNSTNYSDNGNCNNSNINNEFNLSNNINNDNVNNENINNENINNNNVNNENINNGNINNDNVNNKNTNNENINNDINNTNNNTTISNSNSGVKCTNDNNNLNSKNLDNNSSENNKKCYITLCNFINTANININRSFYINFDESDKNRKNLEEQLKMITRYNLRNQMFSNYWVFNQNIKGYKLIFTDVQNRISYLESCKFNLPSLFNRYHYNFLMDFIYKKYHKLNTNNEEKNKNDEEKKENDNLPHHHFFYVNHKEEIQTNNVLYLIEGLFSEKNLKQDYILLKLLNRDGYASIKQLPDHPQLSFLKIKTEHLNAVFSIHRENDITETVETFDDILIRNRDWINIKKSIPSIGQVFNNSMNIIMKYINNTKNMYLTIRDSISNKAKNMSTFYQCSQQNIQKQIEDLNLNKENNNQKNNGKTHTKKITKKSKKANKRND